MQPAVFVIVRASRSVAQPAQIAPLFAPFLVQVPSGSPPPDHLGCCVHHVRRRRRATRLAERPTKGARGSEKRLGGCRRVASAELGRTVTLEKADCPEGDRGCRSQNVATPVCDWPPSYDPLPAPPRFLALTQPPLLSPSPTARGATSMNRMLACDDKRPRKGCRGPAAPRRRPP